MTEETGTPRIDLLIANGIDGATGEYALPPLTPGDFKQGVKGGFVEPESTALKNWLKQKQARHYAIREGLDARRLEEAGWGIVFPVDADPAVVEALRPLMAHRQEQAGDLFKIYADNRQGAVRPMSVDSKAKWLARQGAENYGPVDPAKVPYYLLLVGSPEQIDYRFQYLLDVQYAVGRIHFDTPEEYARYAEAVVAAETQPVRRERQIAFFGAANPGDRATQLSAQYLVEPLARFTRDLKLKDAAPWDVQTVVRDDATRAGLERLLGGGALPGLLFTASHGMGFPLADPRQERHQGALLCQDWPGPSWRKPIPEDFYFSADHLASNANLLGLIAFFFACYGAGTPQYDEFYRIAFKDRGPIAERSFLSRLPQKMLTQGALAVIGHVERAWGYSFVVDEAPSLEAFRSALHALMSGAPVGLAFEYFNDRYAEFSTDLTEKIQQDDWDPVDPLEMAFSWTATSDAKNYVVLGDPAARVQVAAQPGEAVEALRPLEVATPTPAASGENPSAGNGSGAAAADPPAAPLAGAALIGPAAELDYGLLEDLAKMRAGLSSGLSQLTQKLTAFLGAAIDNAATLKVSTYTTSDLDKVKVSGSQVEGGTLSALTVIELDGDVKQIVPVDENGEVNAPLWALHTEMVRQAQASRAEMLRSAVSAVTSLVNLGGPK